MKTSLFLAASSAVLAMAGPIGALERRAMKTDWVYEVVTVTVTEGHESTTGVAGVFMEPKPTLTTHAHAHVHHTHKHPAKPTSTKTSTKTTTTKKAPTQPPPPPPPPTTTVKPVKPTTTTVPPPPPPPQTTTTEAPPPPKTTVVTQPAPATTTAASSGGSGVSAYADAVIEVHNIHRRNHSAPDLTWDSELASWAEITAKKCVFAHDMNQGSGGYGQNLAVSGSSGDISTEQVKYASEGVGNMWYNGEMPNYQYYGQDNPPQGIDEDSIGHFTQLVWKGTTKAGCYSQLCKAGTIFDMDSWFTVCNYNPAGNFGGEYATNVLKPKGMTVETA